MTEAVHRTAPTPEIVPGGGPEREFTVEARGELRTVVRQFLHHKLAVASLVVLLLLALAAFVGPHVWKYGYDELGTGPVSQGPTWSHPMGTDSLGGDVMAQVLRGAQRSLEIALTVAVLSTVFGTLLGAIAGYYRGIVDSLLMRFVDLFLLIPLLAVAAVLGRRVQEGGGNWLFLAFVLAGLSWMSIARIVRAEFLSLREREFVEAARALGAGDRRIIFRHMLPNTYGVIIVNATITVAVAILVESALSFLGLGVRIPDTSLGLLVSRGVDAAQTRPWLFYFPGLFIILIALTVNFVGDGLRDALDPTQRRVRA